MDNKTNNFSQKGSFNKKKQNSFANDLSNEMGKLPPQSIPLEEAILGALLLERKAFEDVVDILKADSFYKDAHQLIYQAMLELSAKGSPIDLLTVRTQLEKNGTLEIVGGAYALVRLTTEVSSSSNVVYHAHEVVERAIKRKMIGVASTVRQNAFEDTKDAFELLDETQSELFEITEDNVRKRTSDMASVYLNTLKDLEEKRKNKTGITGIQSGFTALDRITAGWQRSDLIILAARPGMGKAQPLDAKLLSQNGWKTMGEIKKNDFLAGSDGKFYQVKDVFPQGNKPIYKVTFEDNTSTECCEEHLWITFQQSENKLAVRSLQEIKNTLLTDAGKPNHYIPMIMPIQWEDKKLPLSSYLVGLFVTNENQTSFLANKEAFSFVNTTSEKMAETYEKLQHAFGNKMVNFSEEPFIPQEYLWASVRQRTELLNGMLAFSGRLDKDCKGKYKTDSSRLKNDFIFLIRSLGGMVWFKEKQNEKGENYFYLEFELPASLSDLETGRDTTTNNSLSPLFKYITKIDFIGNKEAACIKIDSSDSLYVTDDFILTHNTAFVLSALANAAVKYDHCVAIFSLEMSAEQLLTRMMSSEAEVESQKLRNGSIADHEWEQLVHRTTQLSASKIFIDDTPAITMLELRAKARRLKSQHNLDMIVIDYLQLMSGDAGKGGGNREQEIAGISRALKQLAKELDVPVMALSQLSRAVETRGGDKKPMLSDLRESGCLVAETQIVEAHTGKIFTIKELADREKQTPFYCLALGNDKKIRPYLMSKVFYSGIKQTYQLITRSGKSIKASANHPFLKLEGWTALENLKVGDRIGVPRSTHIETKNTLLSENELILLAHLLGDGCILPRQPYHYTSADRKNIEIVAKAAKELFNIDSKEVKQENWWHLYLKCPYHLTHGKKHPITSWYESLGIERVRSGSKRISEKVFQSTKKDICLFLHHLWATDGNISLVKSRNGRKDSAAIYYGSSSETLSLQVHSLLLRCGIFSVVRKSREMYNVWIEGTPNMIEFLKQIGSYGERGDIIPSLLTLLEEINPNTNVDTIPVEVWQNDIKNHKDKLGLSWRNVAAKVGISYSGSNMYSKSISREKLNRVAVALESEELDLLSNSDIFWDEITQIIPLEEEHVFDATVPEVHNFVANDIIVHNSIEQDADMVIFLYRPEYYEITQDEMGNPTQGTAEVIIAKNRHGSLETVTLQFVGKYTKFQDIDEGAFSAGNTGYDSGFPNANDNLSPIDDGFTTLPSKGNNMNPIDNDLKNNKSADFDNEPPF
ncbi:replicative DNA helicase [Bernardetia litoralis DSM 6794]|uniref:Replicative DNA helicase n=1 Tax=Bernardetia litoralis (strain ATCC 23117 / DSM 6794 / NBRC 15988 / NCIMB 1366 / Fx l1 / Sio-4) TaxID=880071 RepID=I4ALD0_BERLS|nr:replicative DNA helicase [Bernardetia litoralis]AFM04765.1 replicative DNA helicase [Bernardetia litoralis DSM 6794]